MPTPAKTALPRPRFRARARDAFGNAVYAFVALFLLSQIVLLVLFDLF